MADEMTVRLRTRQGKQGNKVFFLPLPSWIGENLPEGKEFTVEATEDGILFRPLRERPRNLPAWIDQGGEE
jgi:hypothetical protein